MNRTAFVHAGWTVAEANAREPGIRDALAQARREGNQADINRFQNQLAKVVITRNRAATARDREARSREAVLAASREASAQTATGRRSMAARSRVAAG